MLVRADGVAEPRVVAHCHQQRGLREIHADRAPECDLVADRYPEHVGAETHRRLLAGAGAEVGHPDPQRLHHRLQHEPERQILSERHEAALEVEPRLGPEHRHRVQVGTSGRFAHRHPGHDRTAVFDRLFPEPAHELRLRIEESGDRRFRPDHEIGVEVFPRQSRVSLQGRASHLRKPLPTLVDIALNDRDVHRRSCLPPPFDAGKPGARTPQCDRDRERYERASCAASRGQSRGPGQGPSHGQGESASHERDQGTGTVDPQHRQPSRRGAVDLRVPDLEPREPGQRPPTDPLPQRPCRRVHCQQPRRIRGRRDPYQDPPENGGVERETRDQRHRQDERQRSRHVGEAEALVHPGDAGAEGPEPEQPAKQKGAPRRRASAPREKQHGKGDEGDGKESERGERKRQRGPGRKASARGGGLAPASAPA